VYNFSLKDDVQIVKSTQNMSQPSADIAVVGLAVMGQNVVLNMNDHGFVVSVFAT
jgi:hypothetical protein